MKSSNRIILPNLLFKMHRILNTELGAQILRTRYLIRSKNLFTFFKRRNFKKINNLHYSYTQLEQT